MIANVIWNITNTVSGIVPDRDSVVTPFRNVLPSPPIKPFIAPPSVANKV